MLEKSLDKRDQSEVVEKFRELFWEQYPIEGTVKFDGSLIVDVLNEIDGLEDKCRKEGMYPY